MSAVLRARASAAVLLVSSLLPVCATPAAQDTTKGDNGFDAGNSFRGVAFGTTLEAVRKTWDLQPAVEEGTAPERLQLFIRNDENRALGDIAAQEIGYYFFDGKFHGVLIGTVESRHTELLGRMFEAAYGRRPETGGGGSELVWPGRNVSVLMKIDRHTGEARALVFGNAVQRAYDDYVREAARKAAGGLRGQAGTSGPLQ